MNKRITLLLSSAFLGSALLAFAAPAMAETAVAATYNKPGFVTKVENGRLWVFKEGSKELAEFEKNGEPTINVSRIGEGPEGMTIKAPSTEVIEAYTAAP